MSINWYPGHMVKARREIEKNIKLVDMALIVLDARAPISCRNPDLEKIAQNKLLVMVLNKADLVNKADINRFSEILTREKIGVAAINSLNGQGSKEVLRLISDTFSEKAEKMRQKGRRVRAVRVMVAGVPNVGKSTFLNCIVGKKAASTGAKPGVTRSQQWIRLRDDIELMDTPGLMWPKVSSEEQGKKLALLNIVGENAYQEYEITLYLLNILKDKSPDILIDKFKLRDPDLADEEMLREISLKWGHLLRGGVPDIDKTCKLLLRDFRKGSLGRVCLD